MTDPNRVWSHLTDSQAAGLACVMCGLPWGRRPGRPVPVGRSDTGYPVFVCAGPCAARAAEVMIDPEP